MSKITSWDGIWQNGHVYPDIPRWAYMKKEDFILVRVNVWPEGAPDRSEVPHAGEPVRPFHGSPVNLVVSNGIPRYHKDLSTWRLLADGEGGGIEWLSCSELERIPDAPTVKIGAKTYNLADAVARCEPLEEV